MVSMGVEGGFSILIITVTAQRVCMPAQNNVVRAYANHHFAFVHVSTTQLCHCSYKEDRHTQCNVWKGLEKLASRCKLVYLVVDISEALRDARCRICKVLQCCL